MGEALVGAMVAAMRRANRDRAEMVRAARPDAAPRSEGAGIGYLVHPALMPTVYAPGDDASDDVPGENVAARRV
jgi:hypothetical protein